MAGEWNWDKLDQKTKERLASQNPELAEVLAAEKESHNILTADKLEELVQADLRHKEAQIRYEEARLRSVKAEREYDQFLRNKHIPFDWRIFGLLILIVYLVALII